MAKPKTPGDSDGVPPSRTRRGSGDGAESVASAQEATARAAQKGRPAGAGRQRDPEPADTERTESDSTNPDADSAGSFVDNIMSDPRSVAGRSAEDIAQQFNEAGYTAIVEQSTKKGTSGNAVQVRIQNHPEITNIQVHPGGGRHTPQGSPYWKISTSTAGKTWVIPGDFAGVEKLNGNVVRYDE